MKFIAAALVALGLFVPPEPLVIKGYDPGGSIGTYVNWWERVEESGVEVAIEGACVSACVLFTGIVNPEKVCVTENAVLGLHVASQMDEETGQLVPDDTTTMLMVTMYYPKWLQEWIKANAPEGKLQEDLVFVNSEELLKHYRHC